MLDPKSKHSVAAAAAPRPISTREGSGLFTAVVDHCALHRTVRPYSHRSSHNHGPSVGKIGRLEQKTRSAEVISSRSSTKIFCHFSKYLPCSWSPTPPMLRVHSHHPNERPPQQNKTKTSACMKCTHWPLEDCDTRAKLNKRCVRL